MHERQNPKRFATEKYKKAQISFLKPIRIPLTEGIRLILSMLDMIKKFFKIRA